MILSKVVIHGFKSFARKVELKFDGRITAIVGPNGCGKTNVVDAIRWGLGAQKASIFRADRMESVIFGGAQSARPLGMAEVSVTFDNSNNVLPIDYNEVEVTRRLYRSGESEYLINKNQVRLKDITDMIMDTGIGADAYSVIELKMVEDILSEKAEDRRKLLEEAAGVTKYKHRLRAAIRKLDATKNDLLRVNDIIQEVDRNVRSLKRQVDKARRYQSLTEEAKTLDVQRSVYLLGQFSEKMKPLQQELKSLHETKDGRTTAISKEEIDLESIRLQLVEREKDLQAAQLELNVIVEKIHRKEGDIRVAKERVLALEERIVRNTQEIETLKKRVEDQYNHLDVSRRERESLQVKITSTGRIFTNKQKELEVFQQGLNLKRLDLNAKKKEIIECLEAINRLNNDETKLRTRIDNSQGRLERLEEEDVEYREIQKRVHEAKAQYESELKEKVALRDGIQNKIVANQKEADQLQVKTEQMKESLYRDRGELDSLEGRLSFLKNVVESREGLTDATKLLIKDKVQGLLGVLADVLETRSEHRRAIETGMGEAAQYLLFSKTDDAFAAVKQLKAKGGGRASMVALDTIQEIATQKNRPQLPDSVQTVGWAEDLVSADKQFGSLVGHVLGDLLIVEDLDAARNALPHVKGQAVRIATLQGEMITAWGVLQTSETPGKDGGMIGRKQRIAELELQIQKIKQRLSDTQSQVTSQEARRSSLVDEVRKLNQSLREAENAYRTVEQRHAKIEFEIESAGNGLQKNREERSRLLQEIESGREELENLRPRMDAVTERREEIDRVSSQIQTEVERLEEEEKVMEDEVHRHNLAMVRLKGEARNLEYDIERSETLVQETENTIDQRSLEIEDAKREIEKQKTVIVENEATLVQDFADKEKLEADRRVKEDAYSQLRDDLQKREREVREVRRNQDQLSEGIHRIEMEISDYQHRAQTLKDRIRETYEVDLEKETLDETIDFSNADEEIEEIRRKIRNLGPVNLIALNEYDQEQERLDFLTQQRDDLLSAEETLKETIRKINDTARERFLTVFDQVRENFQNTFKRFFQGGEADLRLPEGEDPLEAPVEIYARPAGKQMRDLELLSGGEKALTAISLLFSLYEVKPSPFCILDEIDAPLDDANVERFTRVLAEFAERTQFIIVSHNKMTMRAAQTLYGVTMEEEGVSKIVSVKFEDDQKN